MENVTVEHMASETMSLEDFETGDFLKAAVLFTESEADGPAVALVCLIAELLKKRACNVYGLDQQGFDEVQVGIAELAWQMAESALGDMDDRLDEFHSPQAGDHFIAAMKQVERDLEERQRLREDAGLRRSQR